MNFASGRMRRTGFDTVALSTAFNANARNSSTFAAWIWALGSDGAITRTNGTFSTVTTDTFPSTWGSPATTNEGANWEASLQITSGSVSRTGSASPTLAILDKDSDQTGGVSFGVGTITPQTTAWFSLDVKRRLVDALITSSGGDSTIALAGTLFIRHKVTQQQISVAVSLSLTDTP